MIINGVPGMFGLCFAEEQPYDWRDLKTKCDWSISEKVYSHMIANGVWPEPGGTEPFFICTSHSPADVEKTLHYFEEGIKKL